MTDVETRQSSSPDPPQFAPDEDSSRSAAPLSPVIIVEEEASSHNSNPEAAPLSVPNLARAALERMKGRRTADEGAEEEEKDDDDFRPLKRKRMEEGVMAPSDPEVGYTLVPIILVYVKFCIARPFTLFPHTLN